MFRLQSPFTLFSSSMLAIALAGCGADAEACIAGETMTCMGPNECSGVAICVAEGTGYGTCECGAGEDAGGIDGGPANDASVDVGNGMDAGSTDGEVTLPEELKAFPTAFGAGANVTGGRGGEVIQVTRLDDARDEAGEPVEGTFRYALTRRFPRTIVFRVSGTIVVGDGDGDGVADIGARPTLLALESSEFSDVTVAGQTAPEGGITIRGALYISTVNNQIWRYVRIRHPDAEDVEQFAAFTSRAGTGIIVDHVSSAYGGQQALSITNFDGDSSQAATLQFSLLALAKNGTIMGAVGGPSGMTTVHNNMYTHLSHRVPNLAGAQSYEVINNITYDWQYRLINVHDPLTLNHIGNAYMAGPHTQDNLSIGHKVHLGVDGTDRARIYTADNHISFAPEVDEWDAWQVFTEDGTPAPDAMQVTDRFERHPHPVPIRTSERILASLPGEVGAFRTLDENGNAVVYRDAIDMLVLEEYANGTSSAHGRPTDGFTYPTLPSSEPYADADSDGMPDAWESAHGHNPAVADGANDDDSDGYTNLEEFLNQIDLATVYD